MLAATNIHKSFGMGSSKGRTKNNDRNNERAAKGVLRGLDIAIKPGEITCVIGPSGCGKTTLLRALAMLDYPDRGTITFDDKSYHFPLPEKEIAPPWPQITAVFQSLFLWPHLTLRENVMLPARARNPQCETDIEDLIQLFDMAHFIDHFPNEASIGQRQRVALARALILNPRYILLDEITSALDVEQSAKILTKLVHLKERGIGIFLITHQLGFTRHAADQIIFLDDGKIAEQGGAEILKSPKTKRLQKFLSMAELAA